jgi:hypothetical protein
VLVILDEPKGALLMQENDLGSGSVCEAPCRARVPRGFEYRVRVVGYKETRAFSLDDEGDAVRLEVTKSKGTVGAVGAIFLYPAAAFLPVGLLLLVAGSSNSNDGARNAGLTIIAVSGVGLAIGVPMLLFGSNSGVEKQPTESTARGVRLSGQF